ncbi:MAG: ABC transporter ATP-binding protein [Acidobacteriia bacterium]|nr:ABC transporter ATP-binding protein [Terriglobia bacterium]
MTRELATTKETGGGGFSFADKVAAWFLLQMLSRTPSLGTQHGVITEVQFETRESGWLFDDLLLILRDGLETMRYAISTKSDSKLTKNGFAKEFVRDAWEQWRGVPNATFDRQSDYLGLATSGVASSVLLEFAELQRQAASGAADRLEARLAASSAIQRRIYESVLRSDDPVPGTALGATEAASLLSRIRVFSFDFEFPQSTDEGQAISQCSRCTQAETVATGVQLWKCLVGLAAESRTTGASISVPRLLAAIRGDVELKDYPDYRADWENVSRRSAANMAQIRTTLGDNIHLNREKEEQTLAGSLVQNRAVALVGESGSGKSALVSLVVGKGVRFDRIIWLKPEQLNQPSEPDLTEHLGLQHPLRVLLETSTSSRGILVLDSFERFEGDARARAIELVRTVANGADKHWRILITTQDQSWLDARRALLDAGLSSVEVLTFAKPKPDQIAGKIATAPGVARLFHRRELQPILCNLAILHWVINTERIHPFDEKRAWVGEAELIRWIWQHFCGQPNDRLRRDALLRSIGEKEGERIGGAVPLESIPTAQLGILQDLQRDGVIRVTESSVQFSHDLIGDWARFRVLLASGNDVGKRIRESVAIPSWARAIRLYAQGLAEQEGGLAGWKAILGTSATQTVEAALTTDLFLDGIVYAANVEPLLEQVWPDLIAEKGKILGRLLARLLHSATVPDWRMKEEVDPEDADLATAWFRIPHPLYWLPVLRVLQRHASDVARYAPYQASQAVELWLRTMPPGFPGRTEAGAVAIELAREIQGLLAEGVIITEQVDRPVYEALLRAAPEYPKEVSEVALELAGRRNDSDVVVQRGIAAEVRQARERQAMQQSQDKEGVKRVRNKVFAPHPASLDATLTSPAADGPDRRVPSGFRSAVLDTPALDGLIAIEPQVALEVLLAVCLEEPRSRSESGAAPFTLPGFAHWRGGSPPMYWKGAFGGFLRLSPKAGVDAILRLVNYATEEWVRRVSGHKPQPDDYQKCGLRIVLPGEAVSWAGDSNVFGWYRNATGTPEVVVCALMALEKWFYDLLDRGESIDPWVKQIYEMNRSLAVAGVLTAVGLKQPSGFIGVLRPLLGTLEVYFFQSALAEQDRERIWSIGMIAWANQGKKAIGLAQDWHQMSHRTLLLQDLAPRLMLEDKETGEYLAARRPEWEKVLPDAGEDRERLEFFLARFDPANYHAVQLEDGSTDFEGNWPPHLEARLSERSRELKLRTLALTFPRFSRECLSGQKHIPHEHLMSFFQSVQFLSGYGGNREEFLAESAAAGVIGGIAVLLIDHRDRLKANPAVESWCIETLRDYASRPVPERTGEYDIYQLSPEGFLGEAAVALLPELHEEWVKRAVVRGATALQYQATLYVLSTAYRLRTNLGVEFPRLLNLIVLWAALRRAAREAVYSGTDTDALSYCRNLLLGRYLRGRIATMPTSLDRADRLGTRLARKRIRKSRPWEIEYAAHREREDGTSRRNSGLDLEVLRLSFAFLGPAIETASGAERNDILRWCGEFLDFELSMMPKVMDENADRSHGPIYDFDRWVFQIAAHVICTDLSREKAERFWRPILEQGVVAEEWVEGFLIEFFRVGLSEGVSQDRFARVWKEMVEFANGSTVWATKGGRNWYRLETLWSSLMGQRYGVQLLGRVEYRALLENMAPEYGRWVRAWLGHAGSAVSFAYLLASDSGSVLLPMGLPQLAKAMDSFEDYEWRQERLTDALSSAVRTAWRSCRKELQTDRNFWEAFQTILNTLCTRLDAVAVQIRSETAAFLANRSRQ